MKSGLNSIAAFALSSVLLAADPPSPKPPPILRIVVLPFQNETGEPALDDWCHALPANVRLCLHAVEFTEVMGGKSTRAAMHRANANAGKPMDAGLAGQIARDLEADVVAWGSFARFTNTTLARLSVLRLLEAAGPTKIEVLSSNWFGLTELLAFRLADHLGLRINDHDRQQLKNWFGTSEKAGALAAKAVALELRKSPPAEREQVLRQALKEDARCGLARFDLIGLLSEAGRTNELAEEVKEFLRVQPDFNPGHLGQAWLMIAEDRQAAEHQLREALRVHPGCSGAARGFFMLHAPNENWSALEKTLAEIHQQRPDEIETRILLACARAQIGDEDGAWTLLSGMDRLPEEDEFLDLALLMAAVTAGRFHLAGLELTRLGPKAAENKRIREALATLHLYRKEKPADAAAPITRPHVFSPAELNAELERRLAPDERALAENPLEITPEIVAEARRLTVGLSNAPAQALALFGEVARRGRGAGDGGQRTAGESLQASENVEARLSCQEYAKLFVALARSLGLEAWMVHIERGADGFPCYHDCAALFIEDLGLLVDPAWRGFGLRHQAFMVLDDVQAISHHAMQPRGGPPDLRRLRAGLKLSPDDRWTQLQFVRGLVRAGDLAAAETQLRKARSAGAESWDVFEAAAELEMAREHWQPALSELQHALALSPSNAWVHALMAQVYGARNDLDKSAEHMEQAMALERGEMTREFRREASVQLAAIKAVTRIKTGDSAAREELQRRAEAGDIAAQMALAKACFKARPPRVEEGMRWNLKAAEQGNAQAQLNYAKNLLALRGAAAGQEAVLWLTRAAEQGDDEAQYRLGLILYEGKLVARDNVAAGQWIFLAIKGGNADAKGLLREMQLFLAADELAGARKRADAFKPAATKTSTPKID